MKKIILCVCIATFLQACDETIERKQTEESLKKNMRYIVDDNTGLCYAYVQYSMSGGSKGISITCVPCDSLKKLNK